MPTYRNLRSHNQRHQEDLTVLDQDELLAPPSVPRPAHPLDVLQWRSSTQGRSFDRPGSSSYWTDSSPMAAQARDRSFELAKSWDGRVTAVTNETLIVRIVPLDGHGLEEEAEFLLTDVPEEDRQLVRPGALLFWFLGYTTEYGRRRRTSELKMRRVALPTGPSETWLTDITSIISSADESSPTEG
jgi:hypothetical protein